MTLKSLAVAVYARLAPVPLLGPVARACVRRVRGPTGRRALVGTATREGLSIAALEALRAEVEALRRAHDELSAMHARDRLLIAMLCGRLDAEPPR